MSQDQKHYTLFCHVGLGKTASTYLQYKFFPKLQDICYIQRTKYHRFEQIIARTSCSKYLVSREFDRQFEREINKLAAYDPTAHIIIVLRRNDSWIASQYRRYVKNGGYQPFEKFVDLNNDRGLWKLKDIYFYPKLQMLQELFESPPLVLFHTELKDKTYGFFDKLARYMDVHYNREHIDVHPAHKSYTDKQLKILRKVSKKLFHKERKGSKNKVVHYIRFRSRWLLCHLILYAASLMPERWAGSEPLIPAQQLERIREHFAADWESCRTFA